MGKTTVQDFSHQQYYNLVLSTVNKSEQWTLATCRLQTQQHPPVPRSIFAAACCRIARSMLKMKRDFSQTWQMHPGTTGKVLTFFWQTKKHLAKKKNIYIYIHIFLRHQRKSIQKVGHQSFCSLSGIDKERGETSAQRQLGKRHPLVWSLFVVSNFLALKNSLHFHPQTPQISCHRPRPQVFQKVTPRCAKFPKFHPNRSCFIEPNGHRDILKSPKLPIPSNVSMETSDLPHPTPHSRYYWMYCLSTMFTTILEQKSWLGNIYIDVS